MFSSKLVVLKFVSAKTLQDDRNQYSQQSYVFEFFSLAVFDGFLRRLWTGKYKKIFLRCFPSESYLCKANHEVILRRGLWRKTESIKRTFTFIRLIHPYNWPRQKISKHTIMLFVCQFWGWQTKSIMVCCGIFWSGQFTKYHDCI